MFLRSIALRSDFLLAEQRVVVEIEFAVERHDVAFGSDDQRIDLDQTGIALGEDAVQAAQHLGELLGLILVGGQEKGQIGRGTGRESVCQYVWISVFAVILKKKKKQ